MPATTSKWQALEVFPSSSHGRYETFKAYSEIGLHLITLGAFVGDVNIFNLEWQAFALVVVSTPVYCVMVCSSTDVCCGMSYLAS